MGRAQSCGVAVRGLAPDAVADGAHSRGSGVGGVVGDEKGSPNASDLSPSASRRVACHALNGRCRRVSSRKTD